MEISWKVINVNNSNNGKKLNRNHYIDNTYYNTHEI